MSPITYVPADEPAKPDEPAWVPDAGDRATWENQARHDERQRIIALATAFIDTLKAEP